MNLKENEQMENDTQKKKGKGAVKKSTVLIIILLLLLLIVGIVLVVLLLRKTPEGGVPLDPMSGKYEAPLELSDNMDPAHITLPGLNKLYLNSGNDTSRAVLWNPDNNPCYFQYTIVLQESEEEIYESGLIAPGNAVQEVKFNRTFDAGTYPIIIRISSYDLTDYEQQMNGGEVEAQLIVSE